MFVERINNGETSTLLNKHKVADITLEDLIRATNHEDVLCIDIVENLGKKLGEYLAGLINISQSGTGCRRRNDVAHGRLSVAAHDNIGAWNIRLIWCWRDTHLPFKLKDRAGVIGACMLGRNNMFEIWTSDVGSVATNRY